MRETDKEPIGICAVFTDDDELIGEIDIKKSRLPAYLVLVDAGSRFIYTLQ